MLIRVKPNRSDNIRHRSGWLKADTESRLMMRAGMARTALRARYTGAKEVDCQGRPLRYANEMANRHGYKTLERWANKGRISYSIPDDSPEQEPIKEGEFDDSLGRKRFVAISGQWIRVE